MCLNRGTCTICGCIISLTSPPWVPFFMCLLLLSTGRLGPSRAEVGVGFRCVRLVQALPSSPPSAGLVPCPSASAFLFPCPFRVCPLWARCVVLVFSLSLFFCVPLFASWLSNCHFIVIFISSAPLLRGVCVCVRVYHVDRCKTSFYCRGPLGNIESAANEDAAMFLCKRTCILYTYTVPPLRAYKTQLGGTYILSLLFYMVNVYCDYTSVYHYIYIYIYFFFILRVNLLLVFLHVRCIAHQDSQRLF